MASGALGRGELSVVGRYVAGVAALVTVFLALALLTPPAARAQGFSDVPSGHQYARQIDVLTQLGVIDGYSDGTFRPEAPVRRAQFAKMVVLAMRLPVGEEDVSPFGDVEVSGPGGLYPDNYVAAAWREGITTGIRAATADSRGLFAPYRDISVAQIVVMATRAAGEPLASPPSGYRSDFGAFDPAFGPIVDAAQYNGLLRETALAAKGGPWRSATRGEAVAVLFNLMGTDPESVTGLFLGMSPDLVSHFRLQNRTAEKFTVPLEDLAWLYVKWGRIFGIRADVAWAQMVHETGFGEYGGDVFPEQNNYGGIGATGGVPGNSFKTAELGVIAHIAHLAWYAYPGHINHEFCRLVPGDAIIEVGGDPRHFVTASGVHKGNVRTVQELGGKWAPSPAYGEAVLRHALEIPTTRGW